MERWSYNTGAAAIMELVNTVSKWARSEHGAYRSTLDEALDTLLKLMAPMTPHITAELWETRHSGELSVHLQPWPEADPALVKVETVTMPRRRPWPTRLFVKPLAREARNAWWSVHRA